MSINVLQDYRSALGPVRDQGSRSTCLSQASTAAHEHARRSTMPLSPEYLHYFASGKGSSDGAFFANIVHALENPGQPTEVDCPHAPNKPPSDWLPPARVNLYRRRSELKSPDPDEIEAQLNASRVPVLGISIPHAFYSPTPPWIVSSAGPVRGLHAMVAVGLGVTQNLRYFLVRNSWGVAWGDKGHAWLDDDFLAKYLRDVLILSEELP